MIDITFWKEFKISEIFHNISSPAPRKIASYTEGTTPYVSSGAFNNGIVSYLTPKKDETLEQGKCITVSPLDGSSFYQENDFLGRGGAGSAISILRNENLTELSALFICTIIKKAAYKYNYSDGLNSDNLKKLIIKLPAKKNGDPDWDYMESYMKHIMEESEKSLESLRRANSPKHLLKTSKWGEFRVEELFDIHPTKAHKVTNSELLDNNGINPVIANSGFNNGIVGFTNLNCTEKAGIITFTDTAAKSSESFFYQPNDFVGYAHVQGMYCKNHSLNEYDGNFVATILRCRAGKFDFIRKMTREEVLKFSIKLPITSTGDPDWQYMEDYVKKIQTKVIEKINNLSKII